MRKIAIAFFLTPLIFAPSVLAQGRLDRPSFFRDGQLQMDQEIQRLQQQPSPQPSQDIEHPSQLLTIDQGQLQWQKSIFREAGFSVWMPEGIQSEETEAVDTSIGNLSFEVFATHPKTARFIAAYSGKLDGTQVTNPQTILSAVQDGIITKRNFQLISQQNVSFGQYPGKQLSMQNGEETITFRMYLINQRVYVLAVGQKNSAGTSQDVMNFFDSFRLLTQ